MHLAGEIKPKPPQPNSQSERERAKKNNRQTKLEDFWFCVFLAVDCLLSHKCKWHPSCLARMQISTSQLKCNQRRLKCDYRISKMTNNRFASESTCDDAHLIGYIFKIVCWINELFIDLNWFICWDLSWRVAKCESIEILRFYGKTTIFCANSILWRKSKFSWRSSSFLAKY